MTSTTRTTNGADWAVLEANHSDIHAAAPPSTAPRTALRMLRRVTSGAA